MRRISFCVASTLGLCLISGCSASYVLRQAAGQVELLARAEPVAVAEHRAKENPNTREGLALIQDALAFARRSGLAVGDAYSTFSDIGPRPIVYVLTACPEDQLELYHWSFPVVGPVPYKGFFDVSAVRRARDQLRVEGYETRIGSAAAYSTLGWFSDPIVPSFLEGGAGDRVDLVFHELTHRTVFLDDDVGFNESLARFVARELTIRYLTEKFGATSSELTEYAAQARDRGRLAEQVQATLETLADGFEARTRAARLEAKAQALDEFHVAIDTMEFESEAFHGYREVEWGLPSLLGFDLYTGDESGLALAWERVGGDLPRLIERLDQVEASRRPGETISSALTASLERAPESEENP